MEIYETEEQQVAAVKKWFKENGISLIVGVALGLSAITGWKFYQGEQASHNLDASHMYLSMVNQLALQNENAEVANIGDELALNYSDTPYAALAALLMAKVNYEKGNADAAISQLTWVSTNAGDIETKQVAQVRLMRLLLSEEKLEEVDKLLKSPHPAAFDANYEELKGDFLVAKNQLDDARIAYDKAMSLYGKDISVSLRLKRQNLGD